MEFKNSLVVAGVLSSITLTGWASAEEAEATAAPAPSVVAAAPSEATATDGHATGLMVQARVQAQSNLLSLGGTGFIVGYQGSSYSLGLGLGLTRLSANSNGDSASGTLFQIAPTAIIDVWHSADGRARANLVGSVGYARASISATTKSTTCNASATGADVCTTTSGDDSVSASLIPITVGFGGDYFIGRNFALGAEFGLQAMILAGASTTSSGASSSVDAGGDFESAYGALRATFVLGD